MSTVRFFDPSVEQAERDRQFETDAAAFQHERDTVAAFVAGEPLPTDLDGAALEACLAAADRVPPPANAALYDHLRSVIDHRRHFVLAIAVRTRIAECAHADRNDPVHR